MMTDKRPLKVLVVDDAILYRTVVSEVLSELPGVEIVGTAANGRIATHRVGTLNPDILVLDIEMPEMNGIEVLEWLRENAPNTGAVVFSSFTKKGGELTVKALNLGAFDYIQKPAEKTMEASKKALKEAIGPMLTAYARRMEVRNILRGKTESKQLRKPAAPVRRIATPGRRSAVIAVGISTGGPEALAKMLPKIPEDIGVPILVVQHMPAAFTQSITSTLNSKCAIKVRAGADGESLEPNTVVFAPGGKQMKIEKKGKSFALRVTDDRPENNCKPSADYLFRSVAHHYGDRATGVIMTGMGSDGTIGLKLMKRNGAIIIAQDEATCTVFGMPKQPIETGIVDVIAPLDRIANEIRRTVRAGL